MRLGKILCGAAFLLAAWPCLAQTQDPAPAAPDTAKPATAQSPAPSPATPDKKKPKKVWTNDEIGSVSGQVSVVGEAGANSGDSGARNSGTNPRSKDFHQRQVDNYRSQIEQLQAQIEAADKRIAQLKNFKAENAAPSGGINPTQGYNMVPVEEQVKQLEEKKKQLNARIEDVENDAKKNGIEPGELR